MSDDTIDINQIDTSFGGVNEPEDAKLMEILRKAYRGEIDCHNAVVPIELIKPFSEFKPDITEGYREYFKKNYEDMAPPPLYVYADGGKFVMSDDYMAYEMYKELAAPIVLCVILGDSPEHEGVQKGPGYKMPAPTVDIIE